MPELTFGEAARLLRQDIQRRTAGQLFEAACLKAEQAPAVLAECEKACAALKVEAGEQVQQAEAKVEAIQRRVEALEAREAALLARVEPLEQEIKSKEARAAQAEQRVAKAEARLAALRREI